MQELVENHIFKDFHSNLEDTLKNFINLSTWDVNKILLKQAPRQRAGKSSHYLHK